jgi:choline dehydrogenase-like flavoprotein
MHVYTLAFGLLLLGAAEGRNQEGSRYDFVIVGGGTSGLVVANRLSEMKGYTVAVIEAGDSVFGNANVTDVTGYGRSFGTKIDWAYLTENQIYAGGKKQIMRAGKAIGGTSTINGELCPYVYGYRRLFMLIFASSNRNVVYSGRNCSNRSLGEGWK